MSIRKLLIISLSVLWFIFLTLVVASQDQVTIRFFIVGYR